MILVCNVGPVVQSKYSNLGHVWRIYSDGETGGWRMKGMKVICLSLLIWYRGVWRADGFLFRCCLTCPFRGPAVHLDNTSCSHWAGSYCRNLLLFGSELTGLVQLLFAGHDEVKESIPACITPTKMLRSYSFYRILNLCQLHLKIKSFMWWLIKFRNSMYEF